MLEKVRTLALYRSLGGRILAGFVLMALISLIVALAGIFYTAKSAYNLSDTVDKNQEVTFAILKLNVAVERQSSSVLNYLLVYTDQPELVNRYLQDLQDAQNDFQVADGQIRTTFAQLNLPADTLNKVERLYQSFSDTIKQVLAAARFRLNDQNKTKLSTDPINLWEGPGQSTKDALLGAINESVSFYRTQTNNRIEAAKQQGLFITILSLALVLVAGIGGTTGAIVITRSITRPLRRLAIVAEAIRGGNLDIEVATPTGRDEVASLGGAMAAMTRNLRQSRQELEQSLAQTKRRNRELMAVNRVTAVISRSLDLHTVLQAALHELMDVAEVEYGSLFLADSAGELAQVAVQSQDGRAKPPIAFVGLGGLRVISEIAQQGQVRVVESHTEAGLDTMQFYISVPLKSKGKVLGVANLVSQKPGQVTEADRELYTVIGNQIGIAIENAQLYAQAQQLASLEERNRLARDLHDSVTQTVFSVSLAAEAARAMYIKRPDKVEAQLERVQNLARGALTEMRSLIFQLRPAALEEQGLAVAIQKHLDALQSREQIKIEFEQVGTGRLSHEHEQTLYRIAQEATNNIVKHAHATAAHLKLTIGETLATLTIEDNGTGFDLADAAWRNQERKSLGMTSMRERAELAGGQLTVESAPERGTIVTVAIPLKLLPRPAGLGVG